MKLLRSPKPFLQRQAESREAVRVAARDMVALTGATDGLFVSELPGETRDGTPVLIRIHVHHVLEEPRP